VDVVAPLQGRWLDAAAAQPDAKGRRNLMRRGGTMQMQWREAWCRMK
jgi:hypothetical protein